MYSCIKTKSNLIKYLSYLLSLKCCRRINQGDEYSTYIYIYVTPDNKGAPPCPNNLWGITCPMYHLDPQFK